MDAYINGAAFATYQGVGTDAKIKTTDVQKRYGIKGWSEHWSGRLAPPDPEHKSKYNNLLDAFSRDLMLAAGK